MSSLESSLLLLAGLAVVVVVGYNVWLARTRVGARPVERRVVPGQGPEAPPADPSRGEPSLSLEPGPGPSRAASTSAGQVPASAGAAAPAVAFEAAPLVAEHTDCIVEWVLPMPLSGDRLLHHTVGMRRAGSKPITVEAATLADEPSGDAPAQAPREPPWQAPIAGRQYDQLRVGLLLANRHGPLNAMEFSEFVSMVHTLAEQLSVLADTPDMNAVLARARSLDEVCAQLDAQVGLGVVASEPLGVADLARVAQECGCVERGNNRWARLGERGEVLFSLALSDAPNRLTLLLDVPRAPAAQHPWREMLACATLCATRLGGTLTDDGGRPVAPEHLERIDQQIVQRHQSLEEAGFPAGSAVALRLFN